MVIYRTNEVPYKHYVIGTNRLTKKFHLCFM